ncbi:cholecystokinin receptor type A-like [Saccostrea echinata]|uniref:cholecystokinin receptor type A-like n=1 Tax=Saccostrea echinata TaxID=191078 RepID=UPI002A7ED4C1|nr:cholecystokinin receptor type A-like [Saccostrea echinata]
MDNVTYISEKLETWNRELAESLILNNVILSLYIIVGLLGNSTVIIIYGFIMKGDKEERYFIPFLSAVDLCACLVCASFGIALNMLQATFDNIFACKALQFLVPFFTFSSVLFLLIIAVHRYRKVCKPFGKQMTLKWKQFAMCLSMITALILSLPMIYFYGLVPFPNMEEGIDGLRCSRSKTANKTFSLIFGGFLVIATIIIILSLVTLYSKIGYIILIHFRNTKTINKNKSRLEAENSANVDQFQRRISSHKDPLSEEENKNYSIQTDTTDLSGCYVMETDNTRLSGAYSSQTSSKTTKKGSDQRPTLEGNVNYNKTKVRRRKQKHNRTVVHKFTLMFMLITVIFLICYIPKVIIIMLEARNPKFWEELSDSARAGVLFVYRMYIINNITNPFIYAFLDNKFAKEVKKLFKICR